MGVRSNYLIPGLVLLLAVVAVACGGTAPTPTPTLAPAPTTPPAATATPVPEPTAEPTSPPTAVSDVQVAFSPGRSLAARNGCAGCHSDDGSPKVGPTWKGLFGKEETLADGTTVEVDEDYLYESIVDPNAKIVKGFPADVMPQDFGEKLSDSDIQAIIEYIKTLR